ncbi:MAG TPA: DUF6292 family protein [Pseudonocardiaceae bacterium]|jgi:hypothetical protein
MATNRPGRVSQEQRAAADTALVSGLSGYVRAVADAIDVPVEATDFEVSDTATAYLGLALRSARHPDHDLMLVWSERHGWVLAVETNPAEQPAVLACLGTDLVPEPAKVARFVTDTLAHFPQGEHLPPNLTVGRRQVGSLLARYA